MMIEVQNNLTETAYFEHGEREKISHWAKEMFRKGWNVWINIDNGDCVMVSGKNLDTDQKAMDVLNKAFTGDMAAPGPDSMRQIESGDIT